MENQPCGSYPGILELYKHELSKPHGIPLHIHNCMYAVSDYITLDKVDKITHSL